MGLACRLECPEALMPSLLAAYGEDGVERELRALQTAAPLDFRVNTLRITREEALATLRTAGVAAAPTPFSPLGIRLEGAVALGRLPGLLEGHIDPQDEGAQLVALLLGAQPGEHVVDYCAGAGGKSLALATQMMNKGRLVACDIDDAQLHRSALRHALAGVDNVQHHLIKAGKDKWLKRRKRSYDRVLVDAPCTGIGTWRRNPYARWVPMAPPLHELLPIQAEVLQRGARLVRPGGVLLYATRSLLSEENEDQIARFLASDDGAEFEMAPPRDFHVPLDGDYLRLTPARQGCDGFFGAVLRRQEGGWTRGRRR